MLYVIFQYDSNPVDIDRFQSHNRKKIELKKKELIKYLFHFHVRGQPITIPCFPELHPFLHCA